MTQPLISLENVALAYGKGTAWQIILDETDLKIDAGDFVALVGPSGCGKTAGTKRTFPGIRQISARRSRRQFQRLKLFRDGH